MSLICIYILYIGGKVRQQCVAKLYKATRAEKGLKRECSRVKKVFLCMRTMGVSEPSLHRESTDSLIHRRKG